MLFGKLLPPPPSLPTFSPPCPCNPTLEGSIWDHLRGGLLMAVTQVSNLRSKLETSRRKWEPPLSLTGQQGPLGLFRGLFVKTLVSGCPSTRSLALGHVSHTLGTAMGRWGRGWGGRMWHLSRLPLLGAASFPILQPLPKPPPHLSGLHLALRITTCVTQSC